MFRRLRDDPYTESWIALHSLDISDHRSQLVGEADFVVIVPGKGVLCLEVKASSRIRRDQGLWFYGTDPVPDARGPFKQAAEAMHSIRQKVAGESPALARVLFWSAVLFPYIDFSIESNEWHPWQAITGNQFRNRPIGRIVLDVLDRARDYVYNSPSGGWFDPASTEPDPAQCERIARILRPDFEFFESPASRTERREEELKRYTEEQFDSLDAMEANRRVMFEGPAGTGKTLLALEACRRGSADGRRVLLLCFNRLLGSWLQEQTATLRTGVMTNTLHSYMLSVAGLQPQSTPQSSFWERELPAQAAHKLILLEDRAFLFDELVVDEAQDILHNDAYLDFLDLSLKGGLSTGRWRIFGDFERQAIYGRDRGGLEETLTGRLGNPPRYSLRVNCRNTPRIAELVHLLGGLVPGYSRIRRSDNNVEPDIKLYKNLGHQVRLLSETLGALAAEGFTGPDIVVLSPRSGRGCAAQELVRSGAAELCELGSGGLDAGVRYGTIHSFKGMEASAVVVTDIEEVSSLRARSLFYVAITRALDRLVVLASEGAKEEMLESISGQLIA